MKLFTIDEGSINTGEIDQGIHYYYNGRYYLIMVGNENKNHRSIQVQIPIHKDAASINHHIPMFGRMKHCGTLEQASLIRLTEENTYMFIPEIADAKETVRAGVLADIEIGKQGILDITSAEKTTIPCEYIGQGLTKHSVTTGRDGIYKCPKCRVPVSMDGDSIFAHPEDAHIEVYKDLREERGKVRIVLDGMKMDKRTSDGEAEFHRTMFMILEPGASLRFLANIEFCRYETVELFLYWDGKNMRISYVPAYDFECTDVPIKQLKYNIV